MIKIAHRGNTNGPISALENKPDYILDTIKKGFDVEIDLWYDKGQMFLGHDDPQYLIDVQALIKFKKNLWCHAKNIDALEILLKADFHCFWHQGDDYTLTSRGIIWAYPGKKLNKNSIAVMPEWNNDLNLDVCLGVCSDYILDF